MNVVLSSQKLFLKAFWQYKPLKLFNLNMSALERLLSNNKTAEELLKSLKNELDTVRGELTSKKKQQLIKENSLLQKQVKDLTATLITLETRNGKVQIPLPGQDKAVTKKVEEPLKSGLASVNVDENTATISKQKEKKIKKDKSSTTESSKTTVPIPEAPIDVGRLDFKVGKIVEISKHPDADSLYLEKIECGEEKPRTVVSGLVKFVPIEEMQNRMVVLLCNLKPAKMRGIISEAMVMCASTPDKVEVLTPPKGSIPGDLVCCEGYERNPDAQLNPKKKIFETCAPDLKTNENLVACYKNSVLCVPGKGNIVASTLKNVPIK